MTTTSRNAAIRNMIMFDGDAETKEYVKNHYGIPDHINDWPTIDDMAEQIQKERNEAWRQENN